MSNQYNSALVADMARIGDPSCTEDNNRLYPLVAAGDAEARQQMIEGNMPLVVAKVNAYLVEHPHLAYLRVDLTSAGFMGLTKAVNKMATRRVKNPTAYIGTAINYEFHYLLETEMPIQVSHSQRRRAKANGKEIEVPTVINKMPDHCRLPMAPQVQEVEARELLRSCCNDNVERRILRLRELGCTYEQVTQRVPYKRSQIGNIVRRIEAAYFKKRDLRRRQKGNGKKRNCTGA